MAVDICVLVEGGYPYFGGGLSSWLHALIGNLPDFTFSVVHLGSRPEPGRKRQFRLPDNVLEFHEVHMFDPAWAGRYAASSPTRGRTGRRRAGAWRQLRAFHSGLVQGRPTQGAELLRVLGQPQAGELGCSDLLFAPESWDLLVEQYNTHAPDSSFSDYFWTFRPTHLPLFTILQAPIPRARVYHAVSSGYNGFFGALCKLRTGAPFIVTEHGLSTREREIEIAQSDWIYREERAHDDSRQRLGHFQQWWLNIFRFMTKFTYDQADSIISITAVNQRYQLRDGADPSRMSLIPNGIDVEWFRPPEGAKAVAHDGFVVACVGRVVPIKDIKTFIRAVQLASTVIPDLRAYVVGPTNEDPEYFEECRRLVDALELSGIIAFTGAADVRDYYRQIDVLVLTSLSEGQPLVILEGNCAGVPVVAPDVGACRELLLGITPDDRALGASGIITPPGSPQATAEALIQLWRDPEARRRMANAGLERTLRFYRQERLYDAYREVYQQHLTLSRWGRCLA